MELQDDTTIGILDVEDMTHCVTSPYDIEMCAEEIKETLDDNTDCNDQEETSTTDDKSDKSMDSIVEEPSENSQVNPYFEKNEPLKVAKTSITSYFQPQMIYQQQSYCSSVSRRIPNRNENKTDDKLLVCLVCMMSILFPPIGFVFLCVFKSNKKLTKNIKPSIAIGTGIIIFFIFVIISGNYFYHSHDSK